jgi:hypothetical protein
MSNYWYHKLILAITVAFLINGLPSTAQVSLNSDNSDASLVPISKHSPLLLRPVGDFDNGLLQERQQQEWLIPEKIQELIPGLKIDFVKLPNDTFRRMAGLNDFGVRDFGFRPYAYSSFFEAGVGIVPPLPLGKVFFYGIKDSPLPFAPIGDFDSGLLQERQQRERWLSPENYREHIPGLLFCPLAKP